MAGEPNMPASKIAKAIKHIVATAKTAQILREWGASASCSPELRRIHG
jgi:hypothetical protein